MCAASTKPIDFALPIGKGFPGFVYQQRESVNIHTCALFLGSTISPVLASALRDGQFFCWFLLPGVTAAMF